MKGKRGKIRWGLWVSIGVWMSVFVLFAGGVGLWREYESRAWLGQERFTVVTQKSGEIAVESIDPVARVGVRMRMPANLLIKTVGGRGEWEMAALPKLASKYSWEWVGDSIADAMGIAYTAVETEMNWWDAIAWGRLKMGIELTEVDLRRERVVENVRLADGEDVWRLTAEFDRKSKEWFGLAALGRNERGVRIINTTARSGVGVKWGGKY